jgi:error-prone DNA polymerase
MLPFVPLHNHSFFSFHESPIAPADLVRAAVQEGFEALALTDRDGLSGVVDFTTDCLRAGLTPILGVEITLQGSAHLVLLVESEAGYRNLCRLLTRRTKEFRPITFRALADHSEGLIALSGCRRGHVPALLAQEEYPRARKAAQYFEGLFPGRFYLELFHHHPEDLTLRRRLLRLAADLDLPVVATPNTHYLRPEDRRMQQVLAAIGSLTLLDRPHPSKKCSGAYHFRSRAEMNDLFGDTPEALTNTLTIAQRCRWTLLQPQPG